MQREERGIRLAVRPAEQRQLHHDAAARRRVEKRAQASEVLLVPGVEVELWETVGPGPAAGRAATGSEVALRPRRQRVGVAQAAAQAGFALAEEDKGAGQAQPGGSDRVQVPLEVEGGVEDGAGVLGGAEQEVGTAAPDQASGVVRMQPQRGHARYLAPSSAFPSVATVLATCSAGLPS
jgi:hypothetical protein